MVLETSPSNKKAIEMRHVTKVFDGSNGEPVVAVRDVSLDILSGETLCLIGMSGSGKTTTMKMINRLLEPTKGDILVNGTDVRQIDVIELRRNMGYVIQKGGLFPHMTVARNVGLLCELEGRKKEVIEKRVFELLRLVNLSPETFAARYPCELSGGQVQRVGVARALALDPPFILMDEPFGALDPITREQLHKEFLSLTKQLKKTILLVTHDMTEAFKLADRVALMDKGKLIQAGEEKDFRTKPASRFVSDFLRNHMGDTSNYG